MFDADTAAALFSHWDRTFGDKPVDLTVLRAALDRDPEFMATFRKVLPKRLRDAPVLGIRELSLGLQRLEARPRLDAAREQRVFARAERWTIVPLDRLWNRSSSTPNPEPAL